MYLWQLQVEIGDIMEIDQITSSALGIVCIRENTNGKYHRRTIHPNADISKENEIVVKFCNETWTDEIIEKYEDNKNTLSL